MNKTNAAHQIIGSFEDIGRDIAREVVNAPKDIVGKALESLGASSQKGQKTTAGQSPLGGAQGPRQPDKALPPREWLAELSGMGNKQKAPTVQEIHEHEKREKDRKEQIEGVKATQMAPLAKMSTRPKRGQLGAHNSSSHEESKNKRSD